MSAKDVPVDFTRVPSDERTRVGGVGAGAPAMAGDGAVRLGRYRLLQSLGEIGRAHV